MQQMQETKWSENVILVDGDYIDQVTFNLICNFERMLGRQIPQADLAKWIDCVALDGGMCPTNNPNGELQETLVVFVHAKQHQTLKNFTPGNYAEELNGKAFQDQLGEFCLSAYPIEEMAGTEDFFTDILQMVCSQQEVKRVMVIPQAEDEHIYNKVREVLRHVDEEKRVTVFAMQPMAGGNFRQEILGYSLMAALGIKADEIID